MRISSDLTAFATRTRYPGTPTYTKEDAEAAIQKVGKIFMLTQKRIEALGECPDA